MLHSISWPQYFAAVLLLSAAWYAYVGLRYYQPEIARLLRIKTKPVSTLPEVAASPEVMGAARPEPGTAATDPEELVFGISGDDDDVSDQTVPRGPFDELLAEAETLVGAFEGSDDKKGLLKLLRTLFSKYDIYADEISLPDVIASLQSYAADKLSFPITATEWPQTLES